MIIRDTNGTGYAIHLWRIVFYYRDLFSPKWMRTNRGGTMVIINGERVCADHLFWLVNYVRYRANESNPQPSAGGEAAPLHAVVGRIPESGAAP